MPCWRLIGLHALSAASPPNTQRPLQGRRGNLAFGRQAPDGVKPAASPLKPLGAQTFSPTSLPVQRWAEGKFLFYSVTYVKRTEEKRTKN